MATHCWNYYSPAYCHHLRCRRNAPPSTRTLETNFPNPAILKHNGTWYVFATNNTAGTMADYGKSHTLHNYIEDLLPTLGDWVAMGCLNVSEVNATIPLNAPANNVNSANPAPGPNVWALDPPQRPPDGKFVLYYSATAANASRNHCVDAALQTIDGTIYVAYKVDGNNYGHGGICGNTVPPLVDTPILLQRLAEDAITPVRLPVDVMDRTRDDGPLVEAPTLVRSDEGVHFLFYGSGCTRMPIYDLDVSVRRDESRWRMAFHARVVTPFGGVREMFTAASILNGTTAAFDWS
ncbi:glycosyl hydrolase [Cenococcum geophilum]